MLAVIVALGALAMGAVGVGGAWIGWVARGRHDALKGECKHINWSPWQDCKVGPFMIDGQRRECLMCNQAEMRTIKELPSGH